MPSLFSRRTSPLRRYLGASGRQVTMEIENCMSKPLLAKCWRDSEMATSSGSLYHVFAPALPRIVRASLGVMRSLCLSISEGAPWLPIKGPMLASGPIGIRLGVRMDQSQAMVPFFFPWAAHQDQHRGNEINVTDLMTVDLQPSRRLTNNVAS